MTQTEYARAGHSTAAAGKVARAEGRSVDDIMHGLREGTVVIPANQRHWMLEPIGIGEGLRVKVNANIGFSPTRSDRSLELGKLDAALEAGADAVMDLTITNDVVELDRMRKSIIERCRVPVGTVPIYQAVAAERGPDHVTIRDYLRILIAHAQDGVDFVTVHAGITRDALPLVARRLLPVVSRGGAFLLRWMQQNGRENLLYEHFDDILDVLQTFDVTLSLGDGLRPGCIADATDDAQIHELRILGELTHRARERGVQVMVEGPGHIPLDEIEANVRLAKDLCNDAPLYVLGPLPVETAAGYDHIAGAIGAALAARHGADFLCYLTPREHIGLPDEDDVRMGVIAARIAAVCADVGRANSRALAINYEMAQARHGWDWSRMQELALVPERLTQLRAGQPDEPQCSMCGEYCALQAGRTPGTDLSHGRENGEER